MVSIWKSKFEIKEADLFLKNTMVEHLGIQFTCVGDDFVQATMPVDHRTHQPYGLLHGGASVALAETLGSIAAHMAAEPGHLCVGLEVNANHLRSITSGTVTGTAKPIHIGRSTQVWQIKIVDEKERLVCISRLTVAVLKSQQAADNGPV
jgi:1,4-dihydroxy-2-naphthoyl-CoA hydrolase